MAHSLIKAILVEPTVSSGVGGASFLWCTLPRDVRTVTVYRRMGFPLIHLKLNSRGAESNRVLVPDVPLAQWALLPFFNFLWEGCFSGVASFCFFLGGRVPIPLN